MLVVISPAKTLDFDTPAQTDEFTQPAHLRESRQLIKRLRVLSSPDLSSLMHVSRKIADLNWTRNRKWKTPFKLDNAKQAIFAFKGDVYLGLDAYSMNLQNLDFAQRHLRIISGLYGVLRPLDLIQAYRLEMGSNLPTDQGDNLYQFWGMRITDALNAELKASGAKTLLNLASNEYFKSIKPKAVKADIVTPVFKDFSNGKYRVIGFYAKKARGLMTRFMIDRQITEVEDIKQFNREGYAFDESTSSQGKWVFSRKP